MQIVRDRSAGVLEDIDVALVQRYEVIREDDQQIVRTVEYCLLGCAGLAHTRGIADAAEHFCDRHVQRSGSVVLKRWPAGSLGTAIGAFI